MHLNINPVFTSELPDRGKFEFKAEHIEKVTTVSTPDGLTQRRSSVEHYEHLSDCDNTEVNGKLSSRKYFKLKFSLSKIIGSLQTFPL